MADCCQNCRYLLLGAPDHKIGHCRRFPPQRCYTKKYDEYERCNYNVITVEFPTVKLEEWCGEYAERVAVP